MALVDDLREPGSEVDIERRRFLGMLGSGTLGLTGLGTVITTVRFLEPNVLFEAQSRFKVGRPEEIPVGTVVVLSRQRVYLIHSAEGFYALSAVCTHLGCVTRHDRTNGRILCPCHGSRFDLQGNVTGGPAPKPLTRLTLVLERDELVVDVRKPAEPGALLEV